MTYGTVNADLMTTSDGVSSAGLYGLKNRLINGDMKIDQRNAGASIATPNGYTLDRWRVNQTTTGKLTAQQNQGSVTPPAGFSNYLGITSSSAFSVGSTDAYWIDQAIEGFNFADMAWGTASAATITLSFWVRSSLTGTFGGSLRNSATNRSYPFTYTISAANTWEQKTITIAGDTTGTWVGATNGVGVYVSWGVGVGSSYNGTAGTWAGANYLSATGATSVVGTNGATFYITGVQLEKGSTATSFDYRPYGTELSLCQRYFEKSYNVDVAPGTNTNIGLMYHLGATDAANNSGPYLQFKVTKRAAPTMVPYLATGTVNFWTITNVSGTASIAPNTTTFVGANGGLAFCGSFSAAWTAGTVNGHWTASAEL